MANGLKYSYVLDTTILVSACNWPTPDRKEQVWTCAQLLSAIYRQCHSIILDDEGEIFEEYYRHIKPDPFLRRWFHSMSNEPSKLQSRPRRPLELNIDFDPDDMKFLELTANCPNRTVVSEDSDFWDIRDDEEITNLGIRILSAEEALEELQGRLQQRPRSEEKRAT